MIAKTGLEVDQLLKIETIIVDPDQELLPSGNAKGFFAFFLLREPTFGSALGKRMSQSERSAAKHFLLAKHRFAAPTEKSVVSIILCQTDGDCHVVPPRNDGFF